MTCPSLDVEITLKMALDKAKVRALDTALMYMIAESPSVMQVFSRDP